MRCLTLSAIVLLFHIAVHAQYNRHIVELTDKKGTTHALANPATYLSAKAVERRARQKINIDSTDLPVSAAYLDSIRNVPGVTVISSSKWLNHVLILTGDPNALSKINSFPFVKSTREVAPIAKPSTGEPALRKLGSTLTPPDNREALSRINTIHQTNALNYGNTFNQIHLHEGEYLHEQGFTGHGITIAVLDGGFFSYKTNPVFDSARLGGRILGERDFVTNDGSVNEDHQHGANVLSIMASNRPGILVGSAPHASYWLLRTENTASEYPVEEQNWTVGAEFADSVGADMISSSLGYQDFDNPALDHPYADRDGNTTIVTRAADMAAKKGMIVVNSAGNYGMLTNQMKYISCPADGDSVLTVGGVDVNGNLWPGSSWGPNSNGKIKPNVMSVGQATIIASPAGGPAAGNGTSYACPNMAGLVACLWQAFPEFTNMEIIDYVQRSSNRYDTPDERFGYGIPNFSLAYALLLNERDTRNANDILGSKWLKAYPVPFTSEFNIIMKAPVTARANLQLFDVSGRMIETKMVDMSSGQVYILRFNTSQGLPKGVYYVKYLDGKNREIIPIIRR